MNGTLFGYYFFCKRKCWLAGNGMDMEDNSELVLIGKALHEKAAAERKDAEIRVGNIVMDRLDSAYVT